MESFDFYYKISVLEKFFKSNNSIDINTEYEGEPIGEWLSQIEYAIKTGIFNIKSIHDEKILKYIKRSAIHSKERAERLIHFVSKYGELWYPNARCFEAKLNDITDNEEEQNLIIFLYEQAKEDYDALRAIRSRFYDWEKNKGKAGLYDIDDETLERVRNSGVGRTFGLSDEKQKEHDRLVEQCGLEKELVDYIFKNFSSYNKFKEIFVASVVRHNEDTILAKNLTANTNFVTCIDISNDNAHKANPGYVYLLKDIMGVKFLIFDGTNIDERMKSFLDDTGSNKYSLTEKEREVLNYYYGIEKKRLGYEKIAKLMDISGTRVTQLRKRAVNKLIQKRDKIEDVVFITDENEILNFMVEFFQTHDVFHSGGIRCINVDKDDVGNNECLADVTKSIKSSINAIQEEQGDVVSKIKEEIKRKLNNIDAISGDKLLLQNLSINYIGLSNRTYNCLLRNDITTVGKLIALSREYHYPLKAYMKNLGETSYAELMQVMSMFNLTLEDVNKRQDIFEKNNELLAKPSEYDSACLWMYLKTIQYEISNSYLSQDDKDELNEQIIEIKKKMRIDVSKEKEFNIIKSRIQQLDYKFNCHTGVQILDLPGYARGALIAYEIRSVADIYKLPRKDINYLDYYNGSHFEIIEVELKRMGLKFPTQKSITTDFMNSATYLNAYNVDLIRFFIDKSELSNEEKQMLREALLKKITEISEQTTDTTDKKLSNKIEELAQMYVLLEEKKKELAGKLELIDKSNNPDHTDLE